MELKTGDWVMHCAHGLDQVIGMEQQDHNGTAGMYYMVQLNDLTIWVPNDENLNARLRLPSTKTEFQKALDILTSKPETFSNDRRERNLRLTEIMRDGQAESLCRVIRDLQKIRGTKTWSEYDGAMFKRAQKTLIGEGSYVLSISVPEAEEQLSKLLPSKQS